MIPYQGCAMYAFAEPLAAPLLTRPPEDSILGHPVWTSLGSESDTPDSETYFVSLLKPDLMMVCNNRDFFQELVSHIGLARQPRALPADLPEWKQVDRTSPLWAISHYRDTSFLALLFPRGESVGTTGITAEFGLASGGARARVIAKSDPWKKLVNNPDFKGAAKSLEAADGVWELLVGGDTEAASFAVFALMAALGFVILL
jgi:hypothetical protein